MGMHGEQGVPYIPQREREREREREFQGKGYEWGKLEIGADALKCMQMATQRRQSQKETIKYRNIG